MGRGAFFVLSARARLIWCANRLSLTGAFLDFLLTLVHSRSRSTRSCRSWLLLARAVRLLYYSNLASSDRFYEQRLMRYARFVIHDRHISLVSIQTDIVAVQRVYYNQTNSFSCEYHSFNGRLHGDSFPQSILCVLSHLTHANLVVIVPPRCLLYIFRPPDRSSTSLFIRTYPNTQLNNDLNSL